MVKLLSDRFVPVAVDQHMFRQRKDAEGELFSRVLKQAGRSTDGLIADEVLQYLQDTAKQLDILGSIRFQTTVSGATLYLSHGIGGVG